MCGLMCQVNFHSEDLRKWRVKNPEENAWAHWEGLNRSHRKAEAFRTVMLQPRALCLNSNRQRKNSGNYSKTIRNNGNEKLRLVGQRCRKKDREHMRKANQTSFRASGGKGKGAGRGGWNRKNSSMGERWGTRGKKSPKILGRAQRSPDPTLRPPEGWALALWMFQHEGRKSSS